MNMQARLHVLTGSSAGTVFELLDPKVSVGRVEDNRLCLDDGSVSHYHAMLTRVGHEYQVIDLNSTNGTFVNGQRIRASTPLQHGDKVRFGTVELQYESNEIVADAAPVASPATASAPVAIKEVIAEKRISAKQVLEAGRRARSRNRKTLKYPQPIRDALSEATHRGNTGR